MFVLWRLFIKGYVFSDFKYGKKILIIFFIDFFTDLEKINQSPGEVSASNHKDAIFVS